MKYSFVDYQQIIFYYCGAYSAEIDHLERQAQAVYGLPLLGHETIRDLNGYGGKLPERPGWQQALTSLKCGHKSVVVIPRQSDVSEVENRRKAATLDLLRAGAKLVIYIREDEEFETLDIIRLRRDLGLGQMKSARGAAPDGSAERGAAPDGSAERGAAPDGSAERGHAVWPHSHPGDLAEVEQAPPQAPPHNESIEDRSASEPQANSTDDSAKLKPDAKASLAPNALAGDADQRVSPHSEQATDGVQGPAQHVVAMPSSSASGTNAPSLQKASKAQSVAPHTPNPAPKKAAKKKRIVIKASVNEAERKHLKAELPPGISITHAIRHLVFERGTWEQLEVQSFTKNATRQQGRLLNNIDQIARHKIPGLDPQLDELTKLVHALSQKKLQPGQRAAKMLERVTAIGRRLNEVAHYVNAKHHEEAKFGCQRVADEIAEITAQFKSLLEGGN